MIVLQFHVFGVFGPGTSGFNSFKVKELLPFCDGGCLIIDTDLQKNSNLLTVPTRIKHQISLWEATYVDIVGIGWQNNVGKI